MTAKRIVHIIPTLVRGGAEKQLTLLATRLSQSGFRERFDTHVCLLTSDGPYREQLELANVPIHTIDKKWKIDPGAFRRLRSLLESLRPDLVHTWIFAANSYGRYAALKSGCPRIIAGERCVDPWKSWHELAIDRYLAKRTQGVVTNSNGVVDFYESKGISKDLFEVIPNGIELPDLSPVSEMRRVLLEALELPSDTKLVGTVGRLWPQKRIKDLVWAADLLKCVRDDVHVLVVGDGPLRWRLEKFRDQVEIRDRVHFLGERQDAREIIACLDCFWLASEYEGQSNALMEAMAAGIPVVASDIAGNRDLVVPEDTGFLVPVGDRAAFAQKTESILNDPVLADRQGARGRERMAKHFGIDQMIQKYAAYYDRLLAE